MVKDERLFTTASKSVEMEAQSVSNALSRMNKESFVNAVKAIASAPRIITTACGTSGMAAMKFAHSLCCIERPAKFMSPSEAVHGGLGYVQQKDVVVLISKGGNTTELNPILEISRKRGAITISVTENSDSFLAQRSDIFLQSYTDNEVGNNSILSTSSFLVSVAILDALICALMDVTGFDLKAFSEIHPGGAVGIKLGNIYNSNIHNRGETI